MRYHAAPIPTRAVPPSRTHLDQTGTFGTSRYTIRDLQLFRDSDEAFVAAALAPCAVVRLAKGQRVEDSFRARLYIVLSGALAVADDSNTGAPEAGASTILPGESVG